MTVGPHRIQEPGDDDASTSAPAATSDLQKMTHNLWGPRRRPRQPNLATFPILIEVVVCLSANHCNLIGRPAGGSSWQQLPP